MLSAAIVIFREIFEIALIISVVMVAMREVRGRIKIVLTGLGGGILGAALIAYFAGEISDMADGAGQELFNAAILFAATIMIGWTVIWMSRHARELSRHIRKLGQDIVDGNAPVYSMAIVVAIAVLREGAEIVLFIYGMIASKQPITDIITGSTVGFAGGGIAGLLLYLGLINISPKHIFAVTAWLLIFLASGMASVAAGYLVAAGHFPDFSGVLWDTSNILPENSIAGKTLHVLVGYSEQPMQIQVILYLITFVSLSAGVFLTRKNGNKKAT